MMALSQLAIFENMGNKVDRDSPFYKKYKVGVLGNTSVCCYADCSSLIRVPSVFVVIRKMNHVSSFCKRVVVLSVVVMHSCCEVVSTHFFVVLVYIAALMATCRVHSTSLVF